MVYQQIKTQPRKACIVIPTYNERENIGVLLSRLEKVFLSIAHWQFKILVVDDNSPDQTAEVVRELQKQYNNIFLISGQKKGLGEAYTRGFQYVLDHFETDYIMQMDADLQHDPEDIKRFVQKAETGGEFIIGSRYVLDSKHSTWSKKRKMVSLIANFMARYIAGIYEVRDCTSGFRCISTKFLQSFDLKTLQSNGYSFQMSLLHAAKKKKLAIVEIPIYFPNRKKGFSKLGIADIGEFFLNAIKLRFKRYNW